MKRCPTCNSECEDKNYFCTKCGTFLPQTKYCIKCGNGLKAGERFCTYCGARIKNDFPMPVPQNVQIENFQKVEETEIIGKIGLQEQNLKPVRGIVEEAPEEVNRQDEEKSDALIENSGTFSEYDNLLGESYQNSGSNKTKIWIGFIAVAIIIVVGIVWLSREVYVGSKVTTTPENEIEEQLADEEFVEDNKESTNPMREIYPTDIVYLSGLIDDKYPVHMTLDLNQRIGVYYYDRYGPSNLIGIKVSHLNELGNGQWALILTPSTPNGDQNEKWYGTLKGDKFSGSGVYMGKEMPFVLKVESVSTDSKDPLIQKHMASETEWKNCVFDGKVYAGEKIFNVRVTAQTNQKGEFKDGIYYNLSYNVNFPVDVRLDGDCLYISGKSGHSDFSIEATQYDREFEGYMYADGKSLPITIESPDL